MANLTLDALTYTGQGVTNGTARYVETSAGVSSGYRAVTGTVKPSSDGKQPSVTRWKAYLPTVASGLSGTPDGTLLRFIEVDIQVRSHPLSTAAELTNAEDLISDLVASSQFVASITSLIQPAG